MGLRSQAGYYQQLGATAQTMDSVAEDTASSLSTKGLRSVDYEAGSKPVEEPTSTKELWGWYLFEAASSGFSGSVLPVFLPLLLVTVATDQGWRELNMTTPVPCDDTHKVDCLKCDPGTGDRLLTISGLQDLPKLRVYFGSLGINPVSYATVALGISVIFQLFAFISAGPLVDYGDRRKTVMTVNTVLGSAACMLCLAVYKPDLWWLGGVLCIVANVAYGLAYIAYNTYLPLLTDATPEMEEAKALSEYKQQIVRFNVENKISLVGLTIGAVLGAVCVLISFAFSFLPHISTELILRIACFIGGLWWLVGYIPSLLWLKRRPRPPLPVKVTPWLGWQQVWALMQESKQHKYAWRFLIFFFIFSDGYTTVNSVGIFFAQQELCMSTPELAAIAILVNLFALVGNPLFGYIQRRFRLDNNQMIILGLLWMSVLPVYGIIGYFTPHGSVGLKHASEMFAFSCWYGISLGALLSYSRTLFIDLIPVGKEGAMFALWSLSSRGSAWVGPFVVAITVQVTGDLRSTFIYTVLVIWIPIVLLWLFIDNKEGLLQSGRLIAENDTDALLSAPQIDGGQSPTQQTTQRLTVSEKSLDIDAHSNGVRDEQELASPIVEGNLE